MAVHLNARLKTRYIPLIFGVAILVIVGNALARAEGGPSRLNRRPGFSPITVAPRPGERPTVGAVPLQR